MRTLRPNRATDLSPEACRSRALRLLDRRPYSAVELARRLSLYGFPATMVEAEIAELERLRVLDDKALARDACLLALRSARPVGRGAMVARLRRHGIAAEVAEEACATAWGEAGETVEEERALAAARGKLRLLRRQAAADAQTLERKLVRFLVSRGFDVSTARRAAHAAAIEQGD